MTTEMVIALFAALVFGAATTAIAIMNYEANASLAALAPKSALTATCAQHWLAEYDAGRPVVFRGQPTRTCTLR